MAFTDGVPLSERTGEPFQELVKSLGGQRAKAMLGMTPDFNQEAFRQDCTNLRKRMRDQSLGLLHPRGLFIQYWDMVTGIALLYTLFITTFEVGLDLPTQIDGLFICNQIVALIFLTDIFVQFFLPIPDPTKGEGSYQRNHAKLASRYLRGWFALDVATIIPFDVLVYTEILGGTVKATKLLRILRLVKLLKVLKSSAIIERWQSIVAISSSKQMLLTYSFVTVVLLHWFACGWCLLPSLQGSQRGEDGSLEYVALQAAVEMRMDVATKDGEVCTACQATGGGDAANAALCAHPCLTECEVETLAGLLGVSTAYVYNHEVWTCRAVAAGHFKPDAIIAGNAPADLYVTALLVAMLQMVGGVSTVLPQNVGEFAWFAITVLMGTVLFAAVQGVICGIVTTGDPDEIAWRQNYDALNFMMSDCNLEQEDKVAVRKFFRKSRRLFKRRSYVGLIDTCLSPELKDDVRYAISESLFERVWYLKECDREFLEELASYIQRLAYSPKEDIEAETTLNVLTVGMATRGTTMINAGSCFGDIILSSLALRDTTPARTMIYCEAARISQVDFQEALREYPDAQAVIRQAAIKLALNRAMVIISLHVQMRKMKREGISFPGSPPKSSRRGGEQTPPRLALTLQNAQRLPQPQSDLPQSSVGSLSPGGASDSAAPSTSASPTAFRGAVARAAGVGANMSLPRADVELKELHAVFGKPWREVKYGADGKPEQLTEASKSGLGAEADALIDQVSHAPQREAAAILATLMLKTTAKLDALLGEKTATNLYGGNLSA